MSSSEKLRFVPPHDNGLNGDWAKMWPAFEQAYAELVRPRPPADERQVRRELLFCLLGGHGITYEMNCSAAAVVEGLDVFSDDHTGDALLEELIAVLDAPRFDPPRKDGTRRRYRFPRRKAMLVVQARAWVLHAGALTDRLSAFESEQERRAWLVSCPGLGPKSASWVLRNTGWARDLAILDVHVLRAMVDVGVLDRPWLGSDYDVIERRFLEWCGQLGAAPGVFDLFLWEWQRGALRPTPTVNRPL